MYNILVTNDDGYDSLGLQKLVLALKTIAHVVVVAPSSEKSACGHSLTLTSPLRFIKIDDDFYKLEDGTPSDCIYLGITTLFDSDKKPDLIISGINKGANMGEDITYSGTAGAAMEGVLQGIDSIAVSQVCRDKCQNIDELNYELAIQSTLIFAKKILNKELVLPKRRFLNINIPPVSLRDSNGLKITKAGHRRYVSNAKLHRNPRGEEYYWLGLHPLMWDCDIDDDLVSDFDAINNNYVSITPIKLDMTDYDFLDSLKGVVESI